MAEEKMRTVSAMVVDLTSDDDFETDDPPPPNMYSNTASLTPRQQPTGDDTALLSSASHNLDLADVSDSNAVVCVKLENTSPDAMSRRETAENDGEPDLQAFSRSLPPPNNRVGSLSGCTSSKTMAPQAPTSETMLVRFEPYQDADEERNDDGKSEEQTAEVSEDVEDGEIREDELDEYTKDAVVLAVSGGGKDIEQHNARYFAMDNVVCSHCGVKGHMSFDCPEEADERRCFLCGKPGHDSKSCPDEACFYCGKSGHRQRDCPNRQTDRENGTANAPHVQRLRNLRTARRIVPPHPTSLFCYVCGADGHVDCSLLWKSSAVLSCIVCGQPGHAANGCPEPGTEYWISVANEMLREKRSTHSDAEPSPGAANRRPPQGQEFSPDSHMDPGEIADPSLAAKRFKDNLSNAVRSARHQNHALASRRWREIPRR